MAFLNLKMLIEDINIYWLYIEKTIISNSNLLPMIFCVHIFVSNIVIPNLNDKCLNNITEIIKNNKYVLLFKMYMFIFHSWHTYLYI